MHFEFCKNKEFTTVVKVFTSYVQGEGNVSQYWLLDDVYGEEWLGEWFATSLFPFRGKWKAILLASWCTWINWIYVNSFIRMSIFGWISTIQDGWISTEPFKEWTSMTRSICSMLYLSRIVKMSDHHIHSSRHLRRLNCQSQTMYTYLFCRGERCRRRPAN